MKHIFPHKSPHSLWLAIFVFLLLTSGGTQKCRAQFGLFDTVWTRNNQSIQILSNNDSLFFLYNRQDTTSYLVNTLDLAQVKWSVTSKYPITNIPLKFLENNYKILFLTWDKISNKSHYKVRDATNFNVIDSVEFNFTNFPYQNCSIYRNGISEVDTSVYYSGYCNTSDKKGISYKVNYKTGQTTKTSDSLPYFALTISEDGQYVAGIYYERRNITVKDSYYEILEIRRISDYSLVYKNERYYTDYEPNFAPTTWVNDCKLIFSKDDKYILIQNYLLQIQIFDLISKIEISKKNIDFKCKGNCFTVDSKGVFYFVETYKSGGIDIEHITYKLLNLNNLTVQEFDFPSESPKCVVDGQSQQLVLNDKYLLCKDLTKMDTNFNLNGSVGNVVLLKLNFYVNSLKTEEQIGNPILYPNPTTDIINVGVQNFEPLQEIEIFNIFGESVMYVETQSIASLQRIDVSALPPGMYFVKIGNEKPMKFVVVR